MKYTCSIETVQQNGRFTLFSSKFPSNIYSILFGQYSFPRDFNQEAWPKWPLVKKNSVFKIGVSFTSADIRTYSNRLSNKPTTQRTNQPINQTTNQPINQLTKKPTKKPIN